VAFFLLIGGCGGACTACAPRSLQNAETFAFLMMGPFAGWALVDEEAQLRSAWPMLMFATLTTLAPLAVYFWTRAAPPAALLWAALTWLWWGFCFAIAIWI
jgi:hypothetical protein